MMLMYYAYRVHYMNLRCHISYQSSKKYDERLVIKARHVSMLVNKETLKE